MSLYLKTDMYITLCSILCVIVYPVCSFPYTYNGGLYYNCIENIQGVSTAEQPLACLNITASPVVCDTPGVSCCVELSSLLRLLDGSWNNQKLYRISYIAINYNRHLVLHRFSFTLLIIGCFWHGFWT